MLQKLSAYLVLTLLTAIAWPTLASTQQNVRHPRLHSALYELVKARQELKDAGGGLGGHRVKALKAIDDAIGSLRLALQVKGDNPNVVLRKSDFYRRYKNYPHLRQVLLDLREAKAELQIAKANFGGHKQRALRDINVAIAQVKLAVDHVAK